MSEGDERQQRLKRLREEAAGANDTATDIAASTGAANGDASEAQKDGDAAPNVEVPDVKFRNYKPRDDKFAKSKVPAAKARALDTVTVAPYDPARKQTAIDAYAPKKPHLDLKRDAARSLRKLDRATQRAIDELRVEAELQQGDALQNPQDGVAAAGA